VRAVGVGDAPPRHRAIGINLRRGLERADGFLVVEGKEQNQPLIEITLRELGARGDRMMMIAEAIEQRAGQFRGIRSREAETADKQSNNNCNCFHGNISSWNDESVLRRNPELSTGELVN